MNTIKFAGLAILAAACMETRGADQDAFAVLAVPPDSLGSCSDARSSMDSTERHLHLVMKSLPPGSSRDIRVVTNGVIRSYSELAQATKPTRSTSFQFVMAMLDSTGKMLMGRFVNGASTFPDSLGIPKDLEALQRMMAQAQTTQATRDLDAGEVEKVERMIEYVRKRCAV